MILGQEFYSQDTVQIAKGLLGTCLVHNSPEGRTVGRIVETEAYLFTGDPACHAHRGQTKRNIIMFGPSGQSYIYLIYGMYCCFNVVTATVGIGEAVLIRALEPLEGIPLMEKRRKNTNLYNLCSGPGKLAMAMGLRRDLNGSDLVKGPINILARDSYSEQYPVITDRNIVATTRIGINEGAELPLRFYLAGNKFISRK